MCTRYAEYSEPLFSYIQAVAQPRRKVKGNKLASMCKAENIIDEEIKDGKNAWFCRK